MAWGVPKIGATTTDATGNFNLAEPAGVAQGDLMVAFIAYKGNAAITCPTGWTQPAELTQNTGDTDATDGIASGCICYIVRGASAPSLTWTRTGGDVAFGKIVSYSGVSQTAPYDTGTSATQGSAGNTPTTASFNTANANELIVAMAAYGDQYTVSAFDAATNPATASGATDTTTAPTANTWIERYDANTNTGADTGLGIADAIKSSAGATGTIQATMSSASGRNVLIAAAFKMEESPTVVGNLPAYDTVNYYFDGSDAAASDPGGVWTNDGNAFDSDDTTGATVSTAGSTSSNFLLAEGTNAPGSGGEIMLVEARLKSSTGSGPFTNETFAAIYTDGLGELLGTPSRTPSSTPAYSSYTTLSTPSGGWTWAKVQALETKLYVTPVTANSSTIYYVEIRVSTTPTTSDTTPTLDFTGTDGNGDSIEYQVQVDTVDTFDSTAIDSLSESTQDGDFSISGGLTYKGTGQSFTGNGDTLGSVKFYLRKSGSPTGNATVEIFAHDGGTFGGTGLPTGAALATAATLDVSTLTTSYQLKEFLFSGANQIVLTNATNYFVTIKYSGGDASNYIQIGTDASGVHPGRNTRWDSSVWSNFGAIDEIFYVYSTTPVLLSKVSETDAGFVNPDTGGDTHPFNSGENIQYTVQAGDALAADTYYWRVRGLDPAGSNTYGAWATTRSFEVTAGGGGGTAIKDIIGMGLLFPR